MAALAVPLAAEALDPDRVAEYLDVSIEAATTALDEAKNFANWVIHSAGLTGQEEYMGWIPVIQLTYTAYKLQVKPALTFAKAFAVEAFALMNDLRKWANTIQHNPGVKVVGDIVTGNYTDLAIQGYDIAAEANNFLHWLGLSPVPLPTF
jgi:hypothetical protein